MLRMFDQFNWSRYLHTIPLTRPILLIFTADSMWNNLILLIEIAGINLALSLLHGVRFGALEAFEVLEAIAIVCPFLHGGWK
jgi:hypothetical protein